MKHEWKKHEKDLYGVKKVPALINVPMQSYITISGKGNPNDADFSDRVAALYSLAYAIKMNYKSVAAKESAFHDVHDFSVYPLEGVWQQKEGTELIKEKLVYTIMIRQPDFITEIMVNTALEKVRSKKPTPLLDEVHFETMQDGLSIEILHIGPFDNEPESFAKMDQFAKQNDLKRISDCHREIYLNNAKRVLKSKLHTILRYQVN
jgi:Uncharacterized conserved protein